MYQCEHVKRKRNPKEEANFFSLVTFFFVRHMFRMSLKKELVEEDVYQVLNVCESEKLGNRLEEEWDKEYKKPKPSLFRTLLRIFGKEYAIIGVSQFFYNIFLTVSKPLLVGELVAFFEKGQTNISRSQAYVYGVALVLAFFCRTFCMHNCMLYMNQLAIKIRIAICSVLYRRTLKLSQTSIMEMSSGRIVTLISKDIYTLDVALLFGNTIWIGLVQIFAMTFIIFRAIGLAAFVGVGFMFFIIPFQLWLSHFVSDLRKNCAGRTDERLRLTQEILTTMRIIKMYTWERFYMNRTSEERKAEIRKLRFIIYLKSIIINLGTLSIRISFYLCIISYLWFGHELSAKKIFVVLTCFSTLRSAMAISIPIGITMIAEANASMQRIRKLMAASVLNEAESDVISEKKIPKISLHDIVVALNSKKTIFDKIDVTLHSGLFALTGPLGAGKSSLLKAILRDVQILSGDIQVYGTMSYASQEPWLFPGSLKQNILFGQPYNAERYQKVVSLCQLRSDIDRLPHGDETTIIDKGLNLSRGQQARVNLARAIYKEADIYLLDDSLSALDTNVSRQIFNNCIKDFLKGKLCVLVTHQQQYLKEVDRILYLKDAKLLMEGKYEDLIRSEYGDEIRRNQIDFDNEGDSEVIHRNEDVNDNEVGEDTKLLNQRKVYYEDKKEGKVDPEIYKMYLNSGNGIPFVVFVLMLIVGASFCGTYFDHFVKNWVDLEEKLLNLTARNITNSTEYLELAAKNQMIPTFYTILIACTITLDLSKAFAYYYFTTYASITLHNRTFGKVMRATMQFFDSNLTGNILNRFAKDIGIIDESLPEIINTVIRVFLMLVGIFALVISAHYSFLVYTGIFIVILYILRHYYLPASRSLKRLDGSTRAPVVGHINASLEGLTTIRASRAQKILIKQFDKHQDLHSSAMYMVMVAARSFGFYIDVLCTIYIIAIVFTFLTISLDSSAGNVGLAITQAFGLSGLVQWFLRLTADVENFMTSVERVAEYSKAETEKDTGKVLKNWPIDGKIEFRDVNLKYASNPDPILSSLNFVVQAREKIGVIGRTGAGKSSIISTLFRLYNISGQIIIDNHDIKTLKLSYVRSHLSIIPQAPILFTGTLRTNLDPNNEYTDDNIWQALEAVNIKNLIDKLDSKIEEGGCNFSIGQRQLICLARALLKQNRILILDEATANVDPQTDALIQKTIRERFTQCTVLTIAHRLDTIMDSDKILVLDKGRLVEFDTPKNLLNDENGKFYNMAKQSGLINH